MIATDLEKILKIADEADDLVLPFSDRAPIPSELAEEFEALAQGRLGGKQFAEKREQLCARLLENREWLEQFADQLKSSDPDPAAMI
ncbi:MAG: hypothetical protein R3F11_25400 [Verrucomicrobiales bacterium]